MNLEKKGYPLNKSSSGFGVGERLLLFPSPPWVGPTCTDGTAAWGFYAWAFGCSVALAAARDDYGATLGIAPAGLSPASPAASLAAPDPYVHALVVSTFIYQGKPILIN